MLSAMGNKSTDYVVVIDGVEWRRKAPTNAGQFHVRAEGTNGLARVLARWDVPANSVAVDPSSVTVYRVAGDGQTSARGVTSSVMRDAEPLVARMRAALPSVVHGESLPDPMDLLRERARRLPPSPRGFPTYYAQLLGLYYAVAGTGVKNPVKVLVEITGRPEGTLKLHLRKARAEVSE